MLFAYPASTHLGTVLPKSTFFNKVAPTAKLRELLTQQVDKIVWAHKLATATLNIHASDELPEIQVFKIKLKPQVETINEALLLYLDKAILSPIIFEVQSRSSIQMVACLKEVSASGTVKCSKYLYGKQVNSETQRQPLPISRDFLQLHQQLMATLLPAPLQAGEGLSEALERSKKIEKLAKTIERLEKQLLNKSTQFNKRVEINQQLRSAQQAQNALLGK